MSTSEQHPPQPCTVCGYPRKFLYRARKMGKDNRVAHWPVYETCPNKENPDLHPSGKAAKSLLALEQYSVEGRELARRIPLPEGKLYQVTNKYYPLTELQECLQHFVDHYEKLPLAIIVHPGDATEVEIPVDTEDGEVRIPVWPRTNISNGYGYLFLVESLK